MKEARRRGVKFGRKARLSAAQVAKARKLIGQGERVDDVAALYNVGCTTLYRALAGLHPQFTLE
jgi:DNA invertase Pin-like site-specific DNA recombinase